MYIHCNISNMRSLWYCYAREYAIYFGEGLTTAEYDTAKVLMALMVLSLAITFPNSVFDCNLMAHEDFIFQKSLGLVQSILILF